MIIYGAGLAGLLAANIFRKKDPIIKEKQNSLPNNHTALLRHRDIKISEATSIPFREVIVHKAINYKGKQYTTPSIALSNMYAKKVIGGYTSRSIINIDPVKRYIAPPDFINQLAVGLNIEFGCEFSYDSLKDSKDHKDIISTIPMPIMWDNFNFNNKPDFKFRNITVVNAYIDADCDLYQTVYYANPGLPLYRMSITGNKVIAEFINCPEFNDPEHGVYNETDYLLHFLSLDFGIDDVDLIDVKIKENNYGKIREIPSKTRKEFIRKLTQEYGIYSLGRYATWRNLLLDDVYEDILVIQKIIESDGYLTNLER